MNTKHSKKLLYPVIVLVLVIFIAPSVLGRSVTASTPPSGDPVLAYTSYPPVLSTVYGGFVYWTVTNVPDTISRVPTTGGNTFLVVTRQASITGVTVNGNYVYYADNTGIYRTSVNGGASKLLLRRSNPS